MTLRINNILALLCATIVIVACGPKTPKNEGKAVEDKVAKQMLQGIWINAEDESVAFKVEVYGIFVVFAVVDSGASYYYLSSWLYGILCTVAGDSIKLLSYYIVG